MEILSPAGNKSSMISAVRSGADAVYFGVGKFNARRNAENFTKEDLKEISKYYHTRGVKAYLAVNTLVSDEEMSEALSVVKEACEAGIDALIINDSGLCELVKKACPNMPLHASTQMTVHNVEGLKYLKEKGFKRVVLARENSLADLKEMSEFANKNGIELEIFVTGAHCMSVSGQCLLSSVLGCRSGNRGLCAQPCRLPFSVKGGSGYDLSLKDMNLFEYFDEFEKLNIASLKIEGRMKSEEYVASATYSAYAYKNNLPDKEKSKEVLKNIFSRNGFTDGYLTEKIDKNMFGVRSQEDIEKSKQIKNSIHELYRNERQSIGLNLEFSAKSHQEISLSLSDDENIVTVFGDIPEKAENKPTTKEDLLQKLSKFGGTPYFVKKAEYEIDEGLFISKKALGELKQKAVEQLSEKRGKIKPVPFYLEREEKEYPKYDLIPEKFVFVHDISQVPERELCDVVFLPMQTDIKNIKALISDGYNIGIKTPVFFNKLNEKKLKELFEIGVSYALIRNISAYNTVKEIGFTVVSGQELNLFNSVSLQSCPADYCTISVELSESRIKKLNCDKPKGIVVYGKLPLMIFRSCPIRANIGCKSCNGKITDRKNITFPVRCEDKVSAMYNSVPVYICDKPNLYKNMDFCSFLFLDESKEEVNSVLRDFELKKPFSKSYTRGLYFKGVL